MKLPCSTKARRIACKKTLTREPSCKDEALVGQKGGHAYIWAERGSRPPMVRDNRHDSVHIFGAICPARGTGAAIIMPKTTKKPLRPFRFARSA
jgi:hypothetical protein